MPREPVGRGQQRTTVFQAEAVRQDLGQQRTRREALFEAVALRQRVERRLSERAVERFAKGPL